MKSVIFCSFLLLLGLFPSSPACAKITQEQLAEALRENPQILLDILNQHSEEVFTIVQDGAVKRRNKALITEWKREINVPKKINLEKHLSRGSADAPVTVVAFSDFTCPYCQRGADEVRKLMAAKKGLVRFVFKHYPREDTGTGYLASEYFAAASLQAPEKAWTFYDLLFQNRSDVLRDGEDALKKFAAQAGLDMGKLAADIRKGLPSKIIAEDLAESTQLGIEGTPTFFVNNLTIRGAPTSDLLNQAFEMALGAATSSKP